MTSYSVSSMTTFRGKHLYRGVNLIVLAKKYLTSVLSTQFLGYKIATFCSKLGSFHEAIDDDRIGEPTLLKSKGKLEQKDQSKRAKEIDGDTKNKVCLNQSSYSHNDHRRLFDATDPVSIRAYTLGGPVSRSL